MDLICKTDYFLQNQLFLQSLKHFARWGATPLKEASSLRASVLSLIRLESH
jgi:hypothetical protein